MLEFFKSLNGILFELSAFSIFSYKRKSKFEDIIRCCLLVIISLIFSDFLIIFGLAIILIFIVKDCVFNINLIKNKVTTSELLFVCNNNSLDILNYELFFISLYFPGFNMLIILDSIVNKYFINTEEKK